MREVTVEELRAIAEEARAQQPAVYGYCYPTSKAIVKQLQSYEGWNTADAETRQVRLRDNPSVKHEVAAVPASRVSDTSASGVVIVDATLDQYCTANKEAEDVRVSLGDRDTLQSVYIYETIEEAPYDFG